MTNAGPPFEEPALAIPLRPTPFFLRRRFLWSFGPAALFGVVGVLLLIISGNLLLPFDRTVTLQGKAASRADFFEDEQVRRILLEHRISVHVTRSASREIATHDITSYDFVMPSGQPAADLIVSTQPGDVKVYRPFVTPLVLATYRPYAEALVGAGVAKRGPGDQGTLYYDLDTARFLDLVRTGRTWSDLDVRRYGADNRNRVLAQTSNVCNSNSAGTYFGIVAFVEGGNNIPQTEPEADALAAKIRPLLTGQGLPPAELFVPYTNPEGRGTAPIIVAYENQYLDYQIRHQETGGKPDADRVLLYPAASFETVPQLLSLNPRADRLGELLTTDPDLRQRALELGYRVLDRTGGTASGS